MSEQLKEKGTVRTPAEGTTHQRSLRSAPSSRAGRHGDVQTAIAAIIQSIPRGTHLTAPEVHHRAREIGLKVSLSTVYRALHTLQAHGDVTTLTGERGLRYEAAGSGEDHDHLICVRCGLTIEFVDELTRGFGKSVARRKGFEHKSSRFDILGLCSECKSQDEDHRIAQSCEYLEQAAAHAQQALVSLRQAITFNQSRRFAKAGSATQSAVEKLKDALSGCDASAALIGAGRGESRQG